MKKKNLVALDLSSVPPLSDVLGTSEHSTPSQIARAQEALLSEKMLASKVFVVTPSPATDPH